VKPGEIVLLRLPQPNLSPGKLRPVLVLSELPGLFGNILVCGISSQLHQEIPNWDEQLTPADTDFGTCDLKVASVIRLGWLAAVNPSASVGTLGSIAPERLARLRQRLAAHLALP
jgi:mRNA interferase MazF